jgi:hypothetical protein
MSAKSERQDWRQWLSPLRLSLLVINAICFGGCLVLLALGRVGGPLVLLTVAVGLSSFAGTVGAILASRRVIDGKAERDGVGG